MSAPRNSSDNLNVALANMERLYIDLLDASKKQNNGIAGKEFFDVLEMLFDHPDNIVTKLEESGIDTGFKRIAVDFAKSYQAARQLEIKTDGISPTEADKTINYLFYKHAECKYSIRPNYAQGNKFPADCDCPIGEFPIYTNCSAEVANKYLKKVFIDALNNKPNKEPRLSYAGNLINRCLIDLRLTNNDSLMWGLTPIAAQVIKTSPPAKTGATTSETKTAPITSETKTTTSSSSPLELETEPFDPLSPIRGWRGETDNSALDLNEMNQYVRAKFQAMTGLPPSETKKTIPTASQSSTTRPQPIAPISETNPKFILPADVKRDKMTYILSDTASKMKTIPNMQQMSELLEEINSIMSLHQVMYYSDNYDTSVEKNAKMLNIAETTYNSIREYTGEPHLMYEFFKKAWLNPKHPVYLALNAKIGNLFTKLFSESNVNILKKAIDNIDKKYGTRKDALMPNAPSAPRRT